jgi:hypothetical protein
MAVAGNTEFRCGWTQYPFRDSVRDFRIQKGRYRLRKLIIEIVPIFQGLRERERGGDQTERQRKID